jgi:beta-lactam-binding protein with PASTA domain
MVKNTGDFYSKKASWKEQMIDGVIVGKGAEKAVMPDLTGLPMRKAMSRIEERLIIKFSGNGRVVEQTPQAGDSD